MRRWRGDKARRHNTTEVLSRLRWISNYGATVGGKQRKTEERRGEVLPPLTKLASLEGASERAPSVPSSSLSLFCRGRTEADDGGGRAGAGGGRTETDGRTASLKLSGGGSASVPYVASSFPTPLLRASSARPQTAIRFLSRRKLEFRKF